MTDSYRTKEALAMTLGKLTAASWIVFGVMCLAFYPLILAIRMIAVGPEVPIGVIIVGVLWWGPFIYGMYLSQVAIRNGDRRLLKRGVHGTALVLKSQKTKMAISQGSNDYFGRRVYRYHLRVSLPGQAPYETYCLICSSGIPEGQIVQVAAAPHNRKRVTIDVGQVLYDPSDHSKLVIDHSDAALKEARLESMRARAVARGQDPETAAAVKAMRRAATDDPEKFRKLMRDQGPMAFGLPGMPGTSPVIAPTSEDPLDRISKLAELHDRGVLTDAEFEMQKKKLLGD